MYKRAIILAGGRGTRLKPYTLSMPKPLVPLDNKPILEIIILQLKKYGFEHITITLNHMGESIKEYFGNGKKLNIKIDYTFEKKPLSTMGPLTLIKDLPDNFLVMNGDILTDLNFDSFFLYHHHNNNNFSIASYIRTQKVDYGVLESNDDNRLVDFKEKPKNDYLVSMGIYMLNKKVINLIPENTFFGFDDLMHLLIKNKNFPFLYNYDGYWLDIGRPSDYEKAIIEYKKLTFI